MLPKIKKKITSFLLGEEGKISKQSLLSLGSFISAAVIGGILATKEAAAAHTNDLTVNYADGTATGTHAHHSSGGPPAGGCACGCGGCGCGGCSGAASAGSAGSGGGSCGGSCGGSGGSCGSCGCSCGSCGGSCGSCGCSCGS